MIEYKLLKEIERNSSHTQRTLASSLDVSVGKINYILAGFIKQGSIQAKKVRDHHDKIRWKYYLTPKGISEKVKITQEYFHSLVKEYNIIQAELNALKSETENVEAAAK
ncbi:MAG: MarR family EPS-associated transcriptional regulator [Candidatus Raymondbacteria bacterium RifOxyA12_full_50_37]|uniref:MarR family EPS-associated transcriptional regulator n=1 Tax=Candidatus Raymondbacteria bacterium RIFOXYD12_FULL_49_13 TaxID=1817890 RepID=A0A1F7F6T0_UNCRA|nr:MAG: MarR family EPS-associated transcriptional regulator [Candidatus Raymondbacteria bacterium RifOxyA12_full_50_37]OGJ88470.1 MAG: MarR family EPS-associated transcriptional regulator [Candidatus Raymondbacteria bacterium RIFOXYA2_FULL_49_16]OGJ90647.1 MAG: MarR family EPS-associated transcriptional regulator [Candidatus Raymondbacteria bacterium RifOxyB12_full_50_8]OGJ98930.1 MAG: MarR family EPS-associated transcriptional regulator [Candidatus Raymondbacteria bacterium RIFOXYC2_FULL_50_21